MVGESMTEALHPDGLVDEQRRRRRAAEAVADAAEAAAAAAAGRASAAIAAAAAAAAEAEAAADTAASAAADAESAVAAERHAIERAHAANAVTANETTAVGMRPVVANGLVEPRPEAGRNGAPVRTNGARHEVAGPAPVDVPDQSLAPDEAAVAAAATMTMPRPAISEAPNAGGRAARRRAQEAAAAVAREATRDPETHVFPRDDEPAVSTDGDSTDDGAPEPRTRRARTADGTGGRVSTLLGRFRNRPAAGSCWPPRRSAL